MNYLPFLRAQFPFVLFGFLMMGMSNFGQTYFIALYGDEIRGDFGLSHTGFGGLYSALTLLSALVMLYSGQLIDRLPLRTYCAFVLAGLGAGCLLMGVAQNLAVLALAVFALRHFGQGLCGHTANTAMARSYSLNRGRAVALANMGYAGGEAVFPAMAIGLLVFGWQQSWLVYGAAVLLLVLPLQLRLGRTEPPPEQAAASAVRSMDRRAVLADSRFYLILPLYVASAFLLTGMFFHQLALAQERQWQLSQLAVAFSFYALMKVLSVLLTGWLVDRYSAVRLFPFSALPLSLGLASLMLPAETLGGLGVFVYLGLCGINIGMLGPVGGGLWAELFGTGHLGAIRSVTAPIVIFSTAAAPVLFGLMVDGGLSFVQIAALCVGYLLPAALCALFVRRESGAAGKRGGAASRA